VSSSQTNTLGLPASTSTCRDRHRVLRVIGLLHVRHRSNGLGLRIIISNRNEKSEFFPASFHSSRHYSVGNLSLPGNNVWVVLDLLSPDDPMRSIIRCYQGKKFDNDWIIKGIMETNQILNLDGTTFKKYNNHIINYRFGEG